jgi:hypothetical protein
MGVTSKCQQGRTMERAYFVRNAKACNHDLAVVGRDMCVRGAPEHDPVGNWNIRWGDGWSNV